MRKVSYHLAGSVVNYAEDPIELLCLECGKPRIEAPAHEVIVTADLAGKYAKPAGAILAPREIDLWWLKRVFKNKWIGPKKCMLVSPTFLKWS